MKKRSTPENDTTNDIIEYLHSEGYVVKKIYNGAIASRCVNGKLMYRKKRDEYKGIPDLLAYNVEKEHFMFIEVKSKKGRIKPEQQDFIDSFNSCLRFEALVARDVETVDERV